MQKNTAVIVRKTASGKWSTCKATPHEKQKQSDVREKKMKRKAPANRVRGIGVCASRNAIAPVKQVSSMPVAGEK
jgi:hypothetical protein